jgi:hypothetical protein
MAKCPNYGAELQAFRPPKLESSEVNKLALVVKKYE